MPQATPDKKTILIRSIVGITILLVLLLAFSPSNKFGFSFYGITIHNRVPYLLTDLQIRPDGTKRKIKKTHSLHEKNVRWLLETNPEILIIATGWRGFTDVSMEIRTLSESTVEVQSRSGKTGQVVK